MRRRRAYLFAVAVLVAFSVPLDAQPPTYTDDPDELRVRAEAGDVFAQVSLGDAYAIGIGVPQDDVEALRWYRLAAEQGNALAQVTLGHMYRDGVGVPQDYVEGRRWYRLAAEQEIPAAQNSLGLMYANGHGLPQDAAEAERWWRLAADRGYALAQYNLGLMYANGSGVPQNDEEAARYYRLAADQGLADAQYNLGFMYSAGRGVPQDAAEAVRWLRLAADQGLALAQYNLGGMYANGSDVPQDDAAAVRWLRLAAEQGHDEAQGRLGFMYSAGRGVPQDAAEAVRWLRLGAEQGNSRAQYNLGASYSDGLGVPQDDAEAVRWYLLAAEQGLAEAQFNLALEYYNGRGVPQDYAQAYIWMSLSASRSTRVTNRDSAVRERDEFATLLTASQLAEAQRLTREWAPRVGAEPGDALPRFEDADPSEFRGGTGTAFIVDPSGVLLTAHHVVDQATSITVSCNGRAPVAATVTSSSPTVDLAVLTAVADLGTNTYLKLSPTRQPALGDEVFTIGYPTPALLGRNPKYTNGTVSALSGVGGDASFLQISVPVQPGNSGGPLVNEQGEVIGVVVATADAPAFIRATDSIPQNINWAVKSVFASALFTLPAGGAASTVDPDDVIAHVTEATCLVEATGAAR